jgi:hypothetical protein
LKLRARLEFVKKVEGFGVKLLEFNWKPNYSSKEKPVDRVNESCGPVAGDPWCTMGGSGHGAHWSAGSLAIR